MRAPDGTEAEAGIGRRSLPTQSGPLGAGSDDLALQDVGGAEEARDEQIGRAARRAPSAYRPAEPRRRSSRRCGRRSVLASSWSWVTKIVVRPSRCCRSRSSRRTCTRSLASRFDSGSSSSSTFGSIAMVRASATRCCWPPDSCDGRRSARSVEADQLEGRRDPALDLARAAACAPPARRRRCAPPSCAATAHRTGTPCRRRASRAAGRRCPCRRPARGRLSAWLKPAIRRSRVVLPQPEGPRKANNSPGADLEIDRLQDLVVAVGQVDALRSECRRAARRCGDGVMARRLACEPRCGCAR